jgi:hypothetical protein
MCWHTQAIQRRRDILQAEQVALKNELEQSLQRFTAQQEVFQSWASAYEMIHKSWKGVKASADYRKFCLGWRMLKVVLPGLSCGAECSRFCGGTMEVWDKTLSFRQVLWIDVTLNADYQTLPCLQDFRQGTGMWV